MSEKKALLSLYYVTMGLFKGGIPEVTPATWLQELTRNEKKKMNC